MCCAGLDWLLYSASMLRELRIRLNSNANADRKTLQPTECMPYIEWSLSCVMVIIEPNCMLRKYTWACVCPMNFDGFENIYLSLIAGNMSIASRICYWFQVNEEFITILYVRACVRAGV